MKENDLMKPQCQESQSKHNEIKNHVNDSTLYKYSIKFLL